MSLVHAQELFWNAARARRAPGELSQVFVSRGALSAVARMQIYRRAYWSRHEKCLLETYPRVLARVGASKFRALVASYIERFASTEPCIERAGHAFAEHLASRLQCDHDDPALADVARLEWARLAALLAADAPHPFDTAVLAEPGAAERPLCIAPGLSVLWVWTNALSNPQPGAGLEHERQGRTWVVVWRGPTGVTELEVDDEQGRALARATDGDALVLVCTEFVEPHAVERASSVLMQWVRKAWITGPEA